LDTSRKLLEALDLRERINEAREMLKHDTIDPTVTAKLDRHLRGLEEAIQDMADPQEASMGIFDAIREMRDNLSQAKETKTFKNVHIEITSDPRQIMTRGMLHPELVNCLNLFGAPRQVGTLVDDLASRNKMLAIVRVNDQIHSVVVIKIRKDRNSDRPFIHIARPTFRMGYDFVDEIARALDAKKLPEMRDTGITRDFYTSDSDDDRIEVESTGMIGPSEYIQSVFGIRERKNPFWHNAKIIAEAYGPSSSGALIQRVTPRFQPFLIDSFGVAGERLYAWVIGPVIEEVSGARQASSSRVTYLIPLGFAFIPLAVATTLFVLGADSTTVHAIFWPVFAVSRLIFILNHEAGRRKPAVITSVLGAAGTAALLYSFGMSFTVFAAALAWNILAHGAVNFLTVKTGTIDTGKNLLPPLVSGVNDLGGVRRYSSTLRIIGVDDTTENTDGYLREARGKPVPNQTIVYVLKSRGLMPMTKGVMLTLPEAFTGNSGFDVGAVERALLARESIAGRQLNQMSKVGLVLPDHLAPSADNLKTDQFRQLALTFINRALQSHTRSLQEHETLIKTLQFISRFA
jgi:hypothetical protein